MSSSETIVSKKSDLLSDFQKVEFLVEPILGELSEILLKSVSGDKLFITRIKDIDLIPKIVKKSTPLFSILPEYSDIENKHEGLFLEINFGFKYEKSNIIQDGKNFIATEDGLLIIDNEKPKIIPISLDGSCDVKIADDKMSVNVDIYPSIGANSITTYDDIEKKIQKLGVSSTIKEIVLREKLKDVEDDKRTFYNLCIVEGKQPVHGLDGKIENRTDKREKIENLNSDDFYRINPVISVKENDVIAIVHPPTDGEYGNDIFGNPIPSTPGKKCSISLGVNTSYSEQNRNQIVAKKDGFLNFQDSSISVSDTFTVRGDINFESGNIFAKGSLKVVGNVLNDFTLKLSKDVEIGGYVGDAFIEAGENVLIRGGFLGKGKGVLHAEKDIEVKFVENQRVYTRGSLYLVKDTLNAKLYVKEKIISKTKRSSIIGGHSIAGDFIEVYSVGNDSGTETVLEVGFDYLKKKSIIEKKEKQIHLRLKLEEVDKNILEFARMKRRNSQAQEKLIELANLHKKIEAEIEELKEQNLKTTSEIYIPTASKISISGTIYPGVKIGINGRFMDIKYIMKSKTFILSEDNEVIAV